MNQKRIIKGHPFCGSLPISILLTLAFAILLSGCGASRHATKKKQHKHSPKIEISTKGLTKERQRIVEEALRWEGTPYKYGGSDRGRGTDCSGLVLAVYRDVADIKLPRNSAKQAEFCHKLKKKDVKPGDLVFFATGKDPSRISHVGLMLDDENFIHASTSKGVVISQVSTPYYVRTFKGYGRALPK